MADFSKQWCELNDPEMPWDFDIMEIANELKEDYYKPYICEGFGFSAIARFKDGIKVFIRNWDADSDEQPGEWVTLEKLYERNKTK